MKKISLLILLSMFLISCSSDCDCKKHKAKYKISHSTGETMFDGYEHNDSMNVKMDSLKRMKMRKWREMKKAKKDSIKN